jgi:GrpB-like predicted nucleotidyltransferase (UPF0157 family)
MRVGLARGPRHPHTPGIIVRSCPPSKHHLDMEEDGHREELRKHLNTVLVGGIEKRAIEVVEWRPVWSEKFEHQRARIAQTLGSQVSRIEHVGSTAVPNLAAKPIIDILVSVADPDDEQLYGPQLKEAGYLPRVREPRHRMFRTPERDVHVHIWASGSDDERRHLLFRDWLCQSEADRRLYESTKRQLAMRDWPDMNFYADAKSGVITEIMARAETWAARWGWKLS